MKYSRLENNKKKHDLLAEFADLWDKSDSIEAFAINAALQARFPTRWILGARWYYFKQNRIRMIWMLVVASALVPYIAISLIHGHWFCALTVLFTILAYVALWGSICLFFRDIDKALDRTRT